MGISQVQIMKAFQGSLDLNFQLLKEMCQAVSIEIIPDTSSPLYLLDDAKKPMSLFLPLDSVTGLTAITNKHWDPKKQLFLGRILEECNDNLYLVDVGANVGLFSRQCMNKLRNISQVVCYEPNPFNYELAVRNLGTLGRTEINNCGLSVGTGVVDFYQDRDNRGNSSLNQNAMYQGFDIIKVEMKDANTESIRWVTEASNLSAEIIYKSDTQGSDESIAASFDIGFWKHVKIGIFELWRLAGKTHNPDAFARVLDLYPNKMFENNPGTQMKTKEVMEYLSGDDKEFDDLLVWR